MDVPIDRKLPITIKGRFWLPETAEILFSGELTISSPHNYDLSVDVPHYALSHVGYWESLADKPIPVIFGQTENGKRLTLGECGLAFSGATYNAPRSVSWHKLRFFANRIILGEHVTDFRAIRFSEFSVFFSGFNDFVRDESSEFRGGPSANRSVKREDHIQDFGAIRINCAGGTSHSYGDITERRIVRYWRPSFAPLKPLGFRNVTDTIIAFQRLLCLLQGSPVGFDDIQATIFTDDGAHLDAKRRKQVELLDMIGGYKERFDRDRSVDMLLALPDAGESWPTIISKWFTYHQELAPVLNLYFAVVFGRDLFEEHKFLFMAQAVEGYHRCQLQESDDLFTKAEWKRRKKAVIDAVPDAEREWLSKELEFAPKVSLASRLAEVTHPLAEYLSYFINDIPQFCSDVKNLPNRLTHPSRKPNKLDQRLLPELWRQLKTLFELCVFRDLGADGKIINRIGQTHDLRR
ncbi:MAG TPA: HEPN domain-containing protein [Chthoniobacterales bacterium]|jgi:hypothetical protein|nr:HEPN domain-containing protein [Chthoniobacterales bacterium]